jgi:hypothetical protein
MKGFHCATEIESVSVSLGGRPPRADAAHGQGKVVCMGLPAIQHAVPAPKELGRQVVVVLCAVARIGHPEFL